MTKKEKKYPRSANVVMLDGIIESLDALSQIMRSATASNEIDRAVEILQEAAGSESVIKIK